jgi:hypothetical protein
MALIKVMRRIILERLSETRQLRYQPVASKWQSICAVHWTVRLASALCHNFCLYIVPNLPRYYYVQIHVFRLQCQMLLLPQTVSTVSNETVRYGLKLDATWTPKWRCWQGPVALVQVNYRPVLSSERAPHTKKPQMSEDNIRGEKENLVAGPRWRPDTRIYWPTDRRS